MNWWAFVGFTVMTYFCGPGDPENATDGIFSGFVCVFVGSMMGMALG